MGMLKIGGWIVPASWFLLISSFCSVDTLQMDSREAINVQEQVLEPRQASHGGIIGDVIGLININVIGLGLFWYLF